MTARNRIQQNRLQPGEMVALQTLQTIHSQRIPLPDQQRLTHLQFRRFAGCPVCDLHLHSLVARHDEIAAASIREVVVFHSSISDLMAHASDLPFAVVADPEKLLYKAFRVESGHRALLDPRVWLPILRGVGRSLGLFVRGKQPLPTTHPEGGRFGLPADFLIANDGTILAVKYGEHAFDQWSVDEILILAGAQHRLSYKTDRALSICCKDIGATMGTGQRSGARS